MKKNIKNLIFYVGCIFMCASTIVLETQGKVLCASADSLQRALVTGSSAEKQKSGLDEILPLDTHILASRGAIARNEGPAVVMPELPPVLVISFDYTAFGACKRMDPDFIECFKELITDENIRVVFNSRSSKNTILADLKSKGV